MSEKLLAVSIGKRLAEIEAHQRLCRFHLGGVVERQIGQRISGLLQLPAQFASAALSRLFARACAASARLRLAICWRSRVTSAACFWSNCRSSAAIGSAPFWAAAYIGQSASSSVAKIAREARPVLFICGTLCLGIAVARNETLVSVGQPVHHGLSPDAGKFPGASGGEPQAGRRRHHNGCGNPGTWRFRCDHSPVRSGAVAATLTPHSAGKWVFAAAASSALSKQCLVSCVTMHPSAFSGRPDFTNTMHWFVSRSCTAHPELSDCRCRTRSGLLFRQPKSASA